MNIHSTCPIAKPCHDKKSHKPKTHTIVLQQYDVNGVIFPNTAFPVELILSKKNHQVKVNFPSTAFQTQAAFSPNNNLQFPIIPGGYIGTQSGQLPKQYRPTVQKTFAVSNNDGNLVAFDFNGPLPTILPTFNLEIDTYGNVYILGSNYASVIPPGGHVLNSIEVEYFRGKRIEKVGKDLLVDPRFLNVTQFQGPHALRAQANGISDYHVNDNYKGVTADCWTANYEQTDKTIPVMDVYVRVSHYDRKGRFVAGPRINLTHFAPAAVQPGSLDFVFAVDTAIAINRSNPQVMVASFMLIAINQPTPASSVPFYCRSQDGGVTWSAPTPLDPVLFPADGTSASADNRGVLADTVGNFWYCTTKNENFASYPNNGQNNAYYYFSSDLGVTWTLVYHTTESTATNTISFSYPQIAFGPDGTGRIGLWSVSMVFTTPGDNPPQIPHIIFIPVTGNTVPPTGAGIPGDGNMQAYPNQINTMFVPSFTVGNDGTLYIGSQPVVTSVYGPVTFALKLPGNATTDPLDPSLLQYSTSVENINLNFNAVIDPFFLNQLAYPYNGFFSESVNAVLHDNRNNVTYYIIQDNINQMNQNIHLYLKISFNRGVTWSPRYLISDSFVNNRGYSSAALDENTGTMEIVWYDGRNDPAQTGLQYRYKFLTAKELNKIVCQARKTLN